MNCCVVGLQWGDEGKGKVVDILAENSDVVVRYGGGANAGHTVVIGDTKYALHLMPSGAIRPGTVCVIGNGVVIDPAIVFEEIQLLKEKNISLAGRLFISENAHVVLDYHKTEDRLREESLGKNKIGTTIRGIGPCYADKIGRSYAVRMADLRDLDALKVKLIDIVAYKNKLFGCMYNAAPISVDEIFAKCVTHAQQLGPYITDTTQYLHTAIKNGKNLLFEGAQGSLLDLDHGTFPYVTSSNASSLGMAAGSGVPVQMVQRFLGVVKAYATRVGEGPFPSELFDETGEYIRQKGHEYGTTTGRARRCGWFDCVAVNYTATIGGITEIAMMHLDTLAGIKEIKVCRAYKLDGKETTFFPSDAGRLSRVECIYETVPGWDQDLSAVATFAELPKNAQNYIKLIEDLLKKPITMIGIGPKRTQVIART